VLLPTETTQVDLLRRSARLMVQFRETIGRRPMVLPTADFFPDRFTADRASTQQLLERMQEHAGMVDIPVDVHFIATEMDDVASAHACAGSCAAPNAASPNQRIVPHSEGWLMQLSPGELHHPVALTCTLARSLATIFLVENAPRPEAIEAPLETSVDLTATALGFGALLLEGAHIYSKSCGGPSIVQITSLNVGEQSVALTIFAHVQGHKVQRALSELSTTQKAALGDALNWAKEQRTLLDKLKRDPQSLLSGPIELQHGLPWFSRLFSKRPTVDDDLQRALDGELQLSPPRSAAVGRVHPSASASRVSEKLKDAAREELRALVNDAFDTSAE
jgi:hypothetical protein